VGGSKKWNRKKRGVRAWGALREATARFSSKRDRIPDEIRGGRTSRSGEDGAEKSPISGEVISKKNASLGEGR